MFAAPEYAKDVAIALLGGAVGIAGLLLVVAGFVFAASASFPATTNDALIERYEKAAKTALIPFAVSLLEAGAALLWLILRGDYLYTGIVWGFFLLLLLTALYGFVLILRYL